MCKDAELIGNRMRGRACTNSTCASSSRQFQETCYPAVESWVGPAGLCSGEVGKGEKSSTMWVQFL